MNRILIVTIGLVSRSGTEIVTLETARGLRGRGHEVAILTPQIGPLGNALMREGFVVVDDAGALPWTPTIIQANQTLPLIDAVARFPGVPVVSICHDATVWYNEPIELPSIGKYAAVSLACRDRIARRLPDLADDIELLHNAVDLEAYRTRGALAAEPRRALILSHRSSHQAVVRAACAHLGLEVDALGAGVGEVVADLPARLVQYDVVFAIGRMALEAMAVGCAVVVVDGHGLAGLATTRTVSAWRDHNFGFAVLTRPVSVDAVLAELRRYDAADAARVSDFVREHSSLELYLDRLEVIHRGLIADNAVSPSDHGASVAALSKASRQLALASRRHGRAKMAHRRVTGLRNLLPNLARRIVRPWAR